MTGLCQKYVKENFNYDKIKADSLSVFIGGRTLTINLEKTLLRKYNGLENYIPRYKDQIHSLFEILANLRKISMAPNIMDGEFNEKEIKLILSYMPALTDKLKTLLSIADGTFSFRPAYLPMDPCNEFYMRAHKRLEDDECYHRFVFSTGKEELPVTVRDEDLAWFG